MGNSQIFFCSFRFDRTSNSRRRATGREEAGPASITSSPQAEMHVPMSASSPALPGPVYRPNVQVFVDEMPGWPKYPEARSNDLNGDTVTSPPTPSVNHTATHRQATSTNRTFISHAASLSHPWDSPFVATGIQPPSSTSPPSISHAAPPDIAVHLPTKTHTITHPSVAPATATGNQPISIVSTPAAI